MRVSLCLNRVHQACHFIFNRLNLWANHHLQVMLIQLNNADGTVVLQRLHVHSRHIFDRKTQASNAVIRADDIIGTAQRGQNSWNVIARFSRRTGNGFSSVLAISLSRHGVLRLKRVMAKRKIA